jgi:hypothetical protein
LGGEQRRKQAVLFESVCILAVDGGNEIPPEQSRRSRPFRPGQGGVGHELQTVTVISIVVFERKLGKESTTRCGEVGIGWPVVAVVRVQPHREDFDGVVPAGLPGN